MYEGLKDLSIKHLNEAMLLMQEGKHKEASKELEQAGEAAQKAKSNIICLYIQILKGQIKEAQDEYEEAAKIYFLTLRATEEFLAKDTNNELYQPIFQITLDAIFNLGNLFYDKRLFLQAKSCYELYFLTSQITPKKYHNDVANQLFLGTKFINLGNLLSSTEYLEEAKQSYEKALEIKEKLLKEDPENIDYQSSIAMILYNLGNLLWDMGYFNEAKQSYEISLNTSEKILSAAPENPEYQSDVALVLNDLGALLWHMGRLEEAETRYKKALEMREILLKKYPENVEYQSDVGTTVNNLGNLFRETGRFEESDQSYEKALELREKLLKTYPENVVYQSSVGATLGNIGNLSWEMGRNEKAKQNYEKALEIYENLLKIDPENAEYLSDTALTYNNIGNVLWLGGQIEEAKIIYEKALSVREKIQQKYPKNATHKWYVAITLTNLGNMLWYLGQIEETKQKFEKAIEIHESLFETDTENVVYKSSMATTLNNLGILSWYMGLNEEAKQIFEKARDYASNNVNLYTLSKSYCNIGRYYENIGDYHKACLNYMKSIEYIELIRSQYSIEENKIDFMWNKTTPYIDIISFLCAKMKDSERSWEYLERFKSRTLLDLLRFLEFETPKKVSENLLMREKRLLASIRLSDMRRRNTEKVGEVVQLSREIKEKEAILNEVYNEIREFSPEYVDLRTGQPLGIKEIRKLVANQKEKTAFVEYFTTPQKTFIFVMRSDVKASKVEIVDITEKILRIHIQKYFREIVIMKGRIGETWKELSKYLIDPVFGYIKDCELVYLVPHGLLHYLPLHALNAENKRLIEHFPIVYSPSLTALKYSQGKPSRKFESCLSMGYTPNEEEKAIFEGEAELVAGLFNVKPKLGSEARSTTLKNANNDVIHVSCHGGFDWQNSFNSGLKLADGDLSVKEIFDLDLSTGLLVLSACETGLNEQKPADELIGFTRAFLYAGAESLIVSLWSVRADSTLEFMERFYRKIKEKNMNKAEALQQTQIEFIHSEKYSNPYLWAPFVLIGDWK